MGAKIREKPLVYAALLAILAFAAYLGFNDGREHAVNDARYGEPAAQL